MGNPWVCGFFLFIFASRNLCSGCFEQERQALLRFKHNLSSDPFDRLSSWNGSNCCLWKGVGCNDATGHVTMFDMGKDRWGYFAQLEGNEWSSSLTELTRLSYLDLSGMFFRSNPIPEFIGSMTQLRYLNLSSAGFSGIVPHFIGNLSSLRVLDLNDIEHADVKGLFVDDFTWFSGLLSLERLDLSGVALDEALNVEKVLLYMIPSLRELYLSGCKLSNSHFYRTHHHSNLTLSKIETLDLSSNLFQDDIPLFLQNLTSLRVLDLSYNQLRSSIPVMNNILELNLRANRFMRIQDIGVWRLCQIKRLDLSFMFMEGRLIGPSSNISECAQYALETLILNFNRFSGEIPTSLGRLTALKELHLDWNELTGTIPEALGNLTNLQELNLLVNKLSGSIPAALGNLVLLRRLDLSSNMLSGTIPFSLGKLSSLEILYLNSNSLSAIPLLFGNLSQLRFIDVSDNLLQGPLSDTIGQLSKLRFLDISNNSLSGVVTEAHFVNTSMLIHFAATSNRMLTFRISPDWNAPFQIRKLLLRSCKIDSRFPGWIRTQRSLDTLILSNTGIFGPLPDWLCDLPIIKLLDLSHNFLYGPLTNLPSNQTTDSLRTAFPFIERIVDYVQEGSRMLFLQNNLFNGSIAYSLCNATDLVVLDLSKNRLSGTLPDCFGNLQQLTYLILGSNRLSGVIPSSIGNLGSSLAWLQLNNNSFHGQLPHNLANCTELQLLDVGENQVSGRIPKWIGEKLKYLVILRLHKNRFTGRIPVQLCERSFLKILDLGHNNLTGAIPPCFKNFSGMTTSDQNIYFPADFEQSLIQVMKGVTFEYAITVMRFVVNMDLSSNKLVGEIPEELMLLSGLVGLNLSNNNLTGRIPNGIGDMKSLFSLDLSANSLSGMIPQSISALVSLSHLNLSHNNLSGRIPTGSQLQTLIDPSIYAGNNKLCGTPLSVKCNSDQFLQNGRKDEEDEDEDNDEKIWVYSVTSGFITGFMGILGILVLKNRWCLLSSIS